MPNIKNPKQAVFVLVIIVLVFFMKDRTPSYQPTQIETGVGDRGVSLRVLVYDTNKQPLGELKMAVGPLFATVRFPGGEPMHDVKFIQIQSTIGNTAGGNAPAIITDITGNNIPGENLYNPSLNKYSTSFTLQPGEENIQVSDFIDVSILSGDITFRMDVSSHYIDANGITQDISTYGTVIITIIPGVCSDGTPVGQCDGNGNICSEEDGETYPEQNCCVQDGGIWNNGECVKSCGDVSLDTCSSDPSSGRLTYCDPQTAIMIEDCSHCQCYDYYNNPSIGCDLHQCIFQEYSADISIFLGSKGSSEICTKNPDFNDDGCIDITDKSILMHYLHTTPSHRRWNPIYDLNCDDKVNKKDKEILSTHLGEGCD